MANDETAFYDATLSDSESFEQWTEHGETDATTRPFERWKAIVNEHEALPLDEAVDEALRDYVARRIASMEDAWY